MRCLYTYYIIIAHAPIEYHNLLLQRYGHIPRGLVEYDHTSVVINCDIQFGGACAIIILL